jgi:hypothetical protein
LPVSDRLDEFRKFGGYWPVSRTLANVSISDYPFRVENVDGWPGDLTVLRLVIVEDSHRLDHLARRIRIDAERQAEALSQISTGIERVAGNADHRVAIRAEFLIDPGKLHELLPAWRSPVASEDVDDQHASGHLRQRHRITHIIENAKAPDRIANAGTVDLESHWDAPLKPG